MNYPCQFVLIRVCSYNKIIILNTLGLYSLYPHFKKSLKIIILFLKKYHISNVDIFYFNE